jgi:hypothetical protein
MILELEIKNRSIGSETATGKESVAMMSGIVVVV